jgi:hypothetical protein
MKRVLIIFIIITISWVLFSQNNMQLISSIAGDYNNSGFGWYLNSMDFNSDGFDDIISICGYKTYVYLGNTQFDNIPDMERFHLAMMNPINSGDVNGDGYDDLLIVESVQDTVTTNECVLRFYFGGPNADLSPDHEIIIPYYWMNVDSSIWPICSLGDINNDGYDDIGCRWWHGNNGPLDLAIILGGSFQMVSVVQNVSSLYSDLHSIGDVNNDGFPDFIVGYAPDSSTGSDDYPRLRIIYFGGNGLNLDNNLLLLETYDNLVFPGGRGIGDLNGDGYDDMLLLTYPSSYNNIYSIKLGSSTLPISPEMLVYCSPGYPELIEIKHSAYGDFNGDGYSDFMSAEPGASLWEGRAGVWLGRATPNGLYDLIIHSPSVSPFHQFGWRVTTGDFNGDGYCDIALSAPTSHFGSPFYPGYVHIYAGNAQLADTTVGTEDATQSPELDNISFQILPNPVRKGQLTLDYQVQGKLAQDISQANIVLYNIKGQVVSKHEIHPKHLKKGKGSISIKSLKAGTYISALYLNNNRIATSKLTAR